MFGIQFSPRPGISFLNRRMERGWNKDRSWGAARRERMTESEKERNDLLTCGYSEQIVTVPKDHDGGLVRRGRLRLRRNVALPQAFPNLQVTHLAIKTYEPPNFPLRPAII